MSIWSHISGVIHLDTSVTEDQLLGIYGLISHNLVGSEGGLNISFTRTEKKNFWSSSESDYHVEPFTRLSNIVFHGDLRDYDESNLMEGLEGLKWYLNELNKRVAIERASFVLECDISDNFYYLSFVKGRVRTKKIKTDG